MPPTDRYIANAEFYVRYAETDAQGVVHHSSYVVWLEEARSHYARARGTDYAHFEQAGYALSVIELHVRYAAPARYGDLIAVRCWVDELKSRTVTFGYQVAHAQTGLVYATGQSRHICVNREGRVLALPMEWRRWLLG